MTHLLDTSSVIALLQDERGPTARRVRQYRPADIGISAVVLHELYYGAFRSRRREQNLELVDRIPLEVVPFEADDARSAGEVRAVLASRGTPIGPFDTLIAGQAKARALILVTANTAEFTRVPGLRLEDWGA